MSNVSRDASSNSRSNQRSSEALPDRAWRALAIMRASGTSYPAGGKRLPPTPASNEDNRLHSLMQRPAPSPHRTQEPALVRPDSWSHTRSTWGCGWGLDEYRCPGCGYDLRSSHAPDDLFRCPECGEETHRYKAIVPHKQRTAWWVHLRVPMLACLGIWLLWLVIGLATVLIVPVALFVAFVLYTVLHPLGK